FSMEDRRDQEERASRAPASLGRVERTGACLRRSGPQQGRSSRLDRPAGQDARPLARRLARGGATRVSRRRGSRRVCRPRIDPVTMTERRTLAILVGGGPAPGINSVIGAVTIRALLEPVDGLRLRDGFEWISKADIHHVTPLHTTGWRS